MASTEAVELRSGHHESVLVLKGLTVLTSDGRKVEFYLPVVGILH